MSLFQAQILELLEELQNRLGMAVLFITHDLSIVQRIAHRVCVMQDGSIVEQGTVEQIFASAQHPYTQKLLAAQPKPIEIDRPAQADVVISAADLKVWFPIKKGVIRRTVDHIKASGRCFLRSQARANFGCGRGKWIGKDHPRTGPAALDQKPRRNSI